MACPKCGCKTVYQFDDEDEPQDDRLQRCASCGEILTLMITQRKTMKTYDTDARRPERGHILEQRLRCAAPMAGPRA